MSCQDTPFAELPAHCNPGQGVTTKWDDRLALDEDYQRQWRKRGQVMSHYNKSVWKYKAESVVGPRVFLSCFRSHLVHTRKSLISDFLVLGVFFACLLTFFLHVGGVTKEQASRVKDLTTDFHGLCTFLLGFYVNTCLSRWWAIRSQGIGGLWGNLDDISMLLACYFPKNDEADSAIRAQVLRWGVLSHELIYKQVVGTDDLSDVLSNGLLTKEEHDILKPHDGQQLCSLPQVVWCWVVSYIGHLAYGDPALGGSRLPYPVTVMPQLHELAMKARDSIGLLFTYTDTQVPLRYLSIMSVMVWVHNMIQCLNSALTIANDWHYGDTVDIVIEVVFLVAYPAVYLSLLHVGASMLCPLRDKNDIDLPHGAFSYWMLRENRSFFDGTCQPTGPPFGKPPCWQGDKTSSGKL
eukprot:TRINITY_DN14292_c0_g1_i1.p1 TRINITY_DN14292_c0_g1~~TRINITY_DN14292_c0_g1_i1.p1  ORF type:complete len:408 (+),score=27.25 TRINITY_DN14292_c0_g1_i1:68-1291(+)